MSPASTPSRSLMRNPDPKVRNTYWAHLWMFMLGAPFNAMVQYSPFLAVKTFNAPKWAPALTAIIPAAHLLGVLFTGAINRQSKTAWVVYPMIISNLIFGLLLWVRPGSGWIFAVVIILALLLRAPIISAQSAIFRMNYPPKLRSYALSIPMAFQMGVNALFAWGAGLMFDFDEKWVVPYFLIAAFGGVVGALAFRNVPSEAGEPAIELPSDYRNWIHRRLDYLHMTARQFTALSTNLPFLRYQISYMFFGGGMVAIAAILPFYLNEEFGVNHAQGSSAINVVPNLTIALTMPLWGWLLDRYNPLVMRAITSGVWGITPIFLYYAKNMNGVYSAQLIQGLVWSGSTLIWWLGVNYFARSHEVANLMSLHQTLTGVRGVIMPFVGIYLGHTVGYRNSMIFWFAMMAIGFMIMLDEVRREMKFGKLRSFSETEAIMDQVPVQHPAETG